jgi:hypothetical protein
MRLLRALGVERIGGDRRRRDVLVDDLVDEGGVGAVFQQPPHEVGQQVAVRAHRGIDAAARCRLAAHDLVQRLAHAVQALELEAPSLSPGHLQDRGHGVRVVGGELRVDPVARSSSLRAQAR